MEKRKEIIGIVVSDKNDKTITVREETYRKHPLYGKRVKFENFNPHGRGTGGQKIFGKTEERGEIVGILAVSDKDEIVCMTSQGKTLRVQAETITQQGNQSTGVKVVRISDPDFLVGFDKVPRNEN